MLSLSGSVDKQIFHNRRNIILVLYNPTRFVLFRSHRDKLCIKPGQLQIFRSKLSQTL